MLKRSAALLLCFFLLCAALPAAAAEAGAAPPMLATTRVALVLHPASGTVIYTKASGSRATHRDAAPWTPEAIGITVTTG